MPEPIMMDHHWPAAWQDFDLEAYRDEMLVGDAAQRSLVANLNKGGGVSVWALGDGDIAWWAWEELARDQAIDRYWLDSLAYTSGLHVSDREQLWPLVDEAVRNSHIWMLQHEWPVAERFTIAALLSRGVKIGPELRYDRARHAKLDCNEAYRLHMKGNFWRILECRRVAIVSQHATQVAARLQDPAFIRANGGELAWNIGPVVTCPPKAVPKAPHLGRMLEELDRVPWDLLLCSAGTLSAVLCEHARKWGRRALDIGAFDQVLLGGTHGIAAPMVQV